MNVKTNGATAYSFYITNTNQNFTIRDSILNSSNVPELYVASAVTGGTWNFTNVTRANGNPINISWVTGGKGTLNMMWYLDVNVSDASNGNALKDANVSAWDKNNVLLFSENTTSSGKITTKTLLEYIRNATSGTKYTYYTPHTINTTKTGYNTNSTSVNLSATLNTWVNVGLIESVAPTITIIAPANNSNFNVSSVTFNVSISEQASWCGISISGAANQTMTLNSSSTGANYTNSSIADGSYSFVVSCNDTANNWGYSSAYYFLVDTVYPNISFVTPPTPADGSTQSNTNIFVNVSASDVGRGDNNISTFIDFDNSLVGWWRMDDYNNTTKIVYDSSSYNNSGIVNDTPITDQAYQTDGYYGRGFRFGEEDVNYISVPGDPSLDITDRITLSAWVKNQQQGANHYKIVVKPTQTRNINPWELYALDLKTLDWAQNGLPCFLISNGTLGALASVCANESEYDMPLEQWFNVVGVYNGSVMSLYVNGVLVNTTQTSINIGVNSSTPFTIGGRLGDNGSIPAYGINGSIDDVMVFNRSLSTEEVVALYANQSSRYLSINFTSLASGNHTFKAYAQDTAGNVNSTEERAVFVTPPCGNGICDTNESCSTCPSDCGSCPHPACHREWSCGAWSSCADGQRTRDCTCGCSNDNDCYGDHETSESCECDSAADCPALTCYSASCTDSTCKYAPQTGTACDDGDACTQGDTCSNGVCLPGTYTCQCHTDSDCNDSDVCTTDTCTAGSCQHAYNSNPCDDNNNCTIGDTCSNGLCTGLDVCTCHTDSDCDDGSACTADSCVAGTCQHLSINTTCSDNNACTLNDYCANGACVPGNNTCECLTDADCDDGNICTADSCLNNTCQFAYTSDPCDDANDCTANDYCMDGACTPGPFTCPCQTDADCNDNNPCTDESCVSTVCTYSDANASCDDGSDCTLNDYCSKGLCVSGKDACRKACNDAWSCTDWGSCVNGDAVQDLQLRMRQVHGRLGHDKGLRDRDSALGRPRHQGAARRRPVADKREGPKR